jgi:hypothetical protein
MQHRLDAHGVLLARLPHRWNPLAGREHATPHGGLDFVGEFFVELHHGFRSRANGMAPV